MSDESLLDERQSAAFTGVSPRYLQLLRAQDRGPAYVRIGRRVLYKPADLRKWIEERRHEPSGAA